MRLPFLLLACVLIGAAPWVVYAQEATTNNAPQIDEHSAAINTAVIPVPKLELQDTSYDWYQRHRDELAAKDRIHPQIVLIGDSITHFWGGEPASPGRAHGPIAYKEAFGDLPVQNLGFGYDRTQNVLWRLDHGEFDGLTPKWVVINIGTNNLFGTRNARGNSAQEIVDGILAICDRVHAKSPTSKIIVMGLFPRDLQPTGAHRPKVAAVNALLVEAVKAHPEITYLDIGAQFLQPDGTLPKDMMSDGTHPTEKGYSIWAKALVAAGVRN
jgi:lysophospholipase L1-like esterase